MIPGLILLAGLAGCSQEAPATAALEALQVEFEASELGYQERITEFFEQYQTIAHDYWGTEAGLKAELWVMQSMRSAEIPEDQEERTAEAIVEGIFEEYARSPYIHHLTDTPYMLTTEQREQYFSQLMEDSPHAQVRASAMYSLADAGARGDATDELKQRRVELLEGLIHDYADEQWNETTYGAIATAEMHPHDPADLEIGDPAPEINGWNVDGEAMKLSDYLGKVVVLDFWGDW